MPEQQKNQTAKLIKRNEYLVLGEKTSLIWLIERIYYLPCQNIGAKVDNIGDSNIT